MGRLLALDLGERKTGVALSDPLRRIAVPHAVLRGDPVPAVAALVAEFAVEQVLVGEPRTPRGEATEQTARVLRTVERLRAALSVPVLLVDERYSSLRAQELRREIGAAKHDRESPDDAEAAAVILRAYLDQNA